MEPEVGGVAVFAAGREVLDPDGGGEPVFGAVDSAVPVDEAVPLRCVVRSSPLLTISVIRSK